MVHLDVLLASMIFSPALESTYRFPAMLLIANVVHVESQATEFHALLSTPAIALQVLPLSVEIYVPPPETVATITAPLSEIDTAVQFLALSRDAQVDPESVDTYKVPPYGAATTT